MSLGPRIDTIEDTAALQSVALTYRTATTTTGAPGAGVFYSTIVNRAKMVDLSNDLSVRMGIERVMTQQIMRVDGEVGPAGEAVFKPVNDKYDQVRFVGAWSNINSSLGQFPSCAGFDGYVEVSFYGTGLNFLTEHDTGQRTFKVTIDGGTEGADVLNTGSPALRGRNYNPNTLVQVSSGLSLGIHTIKLRWLSTNASSSFLGFEILNESSSLKVSPGSTNGKKALTSLQTIPYNSGFESGTLGTRGGRVIVYLKSDGTIGKAVQPTGATASVLLASVDHAAANEEVIRTYNVREFSAGRTDDFTSSSSSASKAFTLDDGTTTLVANFAYMSHPQISPGTVGLDGLSGGFFVFTFVGTGLDATFMGSIGAATSYSSILVDGGSSVGTMSFVSNQAATVFKIASGLPYGTHTVKIVNTQVAALGAGLLNFSVYGPKKPSIPSGAMELADYNIMADYVASSTAATGVVGNGILRKMVNHEMVFVGSYVVNETYVTGQSGIRLYTSTNGNYGEFTFLGTGVEAHTGIDNSPHSVTYSIDGSANLSVYTTNYSTTATGTPSFTASTGAASWTPTSVGLVRLQISGLPYGKHTLRITNNNSSPGLQFDCFDVITPIHVHKNNGPYIVQNTLSVGSQGINDGRKFGSQLPVFNSCNRSQGTGTFTTTSTAVIPVPDMTCTIKTKGNPIRVSSLINISGSLSGNGPALYIYIDGSPVNPLINNDSSLFIPLNIGGVFPVPAGVHIVQLYWAQAGGTGTGFLDRRLLFVEEIATS